MRVNSIASEVAYFAKFPCDPRTRKPRQPGLAGEELLHGGLFEVALLGQHGIQRPQQRIHIPQRLRDGALFKNRARNANKKRFNLPECELGLRSNRSNRFDNTLNSLRHQLIKQEVLIARYISDSVCVFRQICAV